MPIRITQKDRDNEAMVAKKLENCLGITVEHSGDMDEYDFILYEGNKAIALAELKTRYNDSDKYPTVFLEKHKRDFLEQKCQEINDTHDDKSNHLVPVFLVQFDDVLMWIQLGASLNFGRPRIAGTKKRGDPRDMDRIYFVPIDQMMKVCD